MKVKDLITTLEQLPPEMDVAILDWRHNLLSDIGDGSGQGLYDDFRVEVIADEEERPGVSEEDRNRASWCALLFDNPEFEDEFREPRRCRVCGCTDADCTQCVRKTGQPCYWVAEDLCSACIDETIVQPEKPKYEEEIAKA